MILFYVKQLPLNFTFVLLSKELNSGARTVCCLGCLIVLLDNPLDFHDVVGDRSNFEIFVFRLKN